MVLTEEEQRMLTIDDLKKLKRRGGRGNGTPLTVASTVTFNLREGKRVCFHSFSYFSSPSGETKFSHQDGFGRLGGANSWDDFTHEGKKWIETNYIANGCKIIIDVDNDVRTVKASDLKLLE